MSAVQHASQSVLKSCFSFIGTLAATDMFGATDSRTLIRNACSTFICLFLLSMNLGCRQADPVLLSVLRDGEDLLVITELDLPASHAITQGKLLTSRTLLSTDQLIAAYSRGDSGLQTINGTIDEGSSSFRTAKFRFEGFFNAHSDVSLHYYWVGLAGRRDNPTDAGAVQVIDVSESIVGYIESYKIAKSAKE